MKINISYPSTGCQKVIEVDDDKKLRAFYDKRMSQEVEGDVLGDEFKGYVFRISGGNDKEGFAMKQGILTSQRVRILFSDGHSCFRIRRKGERKRKSIRGCIVSSALSVLNLVIVKKGDADIPGLTDETKPRRLGPKRASRIRKLFNLSKKDDVRQYVVRRQINKEKKSYSKAPKIQRLITPRRLQHKRQLLAEKRKRWEKSAQEAKEYNELFAKFLQEKREQKLARKRSASRRESTKETAAAPAAPAKKQATGKAAEQPKKQAPAAAPAKKDEKKGGDKKAAAEQPKKQAAAAAPAKKDEKKGGDKKAAAEQPKKQAAAEPKKQAAQQPKKQAAEPKKQAAEQPKKADKKEAAAPAKQQSKGKKQ